MPLSQISQIESSLRVVQKRCPELRVEEAMLCRTAVILGRDLTARFDAQLAPAGIAELEYRLLLNLSALGGSASPGELCAALAQSPANLTRVGDLLAERGLVTRAPDEDDRRRQILTLTPAGAKLVQELLPRLMQSLGKLFEGFSLKERERFQEFLERLIGALDALPGPTEGTP